MCCRPAAQFSDKSSMTRTLPHPPRAHFVKVEFVLQGGQHRIVDLACPMELQQGITPGGNRREHRGKMFRPLVVEAAARLVEPRDGSDLEGILLDKPGMQMA